MWENHLSIILLCFIFVKVTFIILAFTPTVTLALGLSKATANSGLRIILKLPLSFPHLKYEEKSRTKYSCDLHKHVRNVSSS